MVSPDLYQSYSTVLLDRLGLVSIPPGIKLSGLLRVDLKDISTLPTISLFA